jgi:hypothetical protein
MYQKEIEEARKKINNPILKTHVSAKKCTMDESCPKYNQVQITDHYVCQYCGWGLDTIEEYRPRK